MCFVTQSCPTLCDPWTVAHQAPLFMEFSRQEYCSGLPCPPSGHLLDPGIEPLSEPPGKPLHFYGETSKEPQSKRLLRKGQRLSGFVKTRGLMWSLKGF